MPCLPPSLSLSSSPLSSSPRPFPVSFSQDRSGAVDEAEFGRALARLGLSMDRATLRAVLASADPNGDGVLEYKVSPSDPPSPLPPNPDMSFLFRCRSLIRF